MPINSCYNTTRGGAHTIMVRDGYTAAHPLLNGNVEDGANLMIPKYKPHTTHWNEMNCGHIDRKSDRACKGCRNRYDVGDQLSFDFD
jgi:hypothetical protein